LKVAILTISDKGHTGKRKDTSGPAIREIVSKMGWTVGEYAIVPDEIKAIKKALVGWSDAGINLILTTGGTGFSPRDNTPEATLAVIGKAAPGISEAIRYYGLQKTPKAALSRAVSGIRKQSLIINLPGSERAVRESLEAIIEILPHAIEVLCGQVSECGAAKKRRH
jgi:molybdenum cofactor synthesis domain-containing protein